jgi:hypothetical protein
MTQPFSALIALTVSMVLAPAAQAAEPVTLRCVLDAPNEKRAMDLTLNEAEGSATYFWPGNGATVKSPAAFAPSTVSFAGFTVNRVTLEIQQVNDALAVKLSHYPPVTFGKCQLQKVERAF